MKKFSFITWIILVSVLFCLAIGFDVSPYLRGPSYYAPEWRWAYLFISTLSRIYLPILVAFCGFALFYWAEKKKHQKAKSLLVLLSALVLLFFCFQFSLLFFSRSGIAVLIHRIINPEINGYFTAALTIHSVPDFLRNYNSVMLTFVYHAKAHPPGAILLFYYLHQLLAFFPQLGDIAAHQVPNRSDVRAIWDTLSASAKAAVFASALVIPFLSSMSIIPLYFTAKLLYGAKTATRSIFLFLFIPSLLFFLPINDAFLHIFSITAFCFFVYGLKNNSIWQLLLSGTILFLGIFFNLSLLPVLILFFMYFLLHEYTSLKKRFTVVLKKGILFTLGIFIPFLLLFVFFQFNFIQVTQTIMANVPDIHTRSYTIWIFYNLYDFFVFTGIPVAMLYFFSVKTLVSNTFREQWKKDRSACRCFYRYAPYC